MVNRIIDLFGVKILKALKYIISWPSEEKKFIRATGTVLSEMQAGDIEKANETLLIASKKYIYSLKGLPKNHREDLISILVNKHKGLTESTFEYSYYSETIKNIDYNLLSSDQWKFLYGLFLRNGLIQLGFNCREYALKVAVCEAEDDQENSDIIANAAKATIESRDFKTSNEYLKKLKKKQVHLADDLNNFQKLFLSYNNFKDKIINENYSEADRSFYNFVSNKSIAIVGPAPTPQYSGEEIDSFDIVIRVSYFGNLPDGSEINIGSRTDISYYGNVFSKLISKKINEFSFANNLKFCVFKSQIPNNEFQNEMSKFGKARYFRKKNVFFNGSPMMIQNALLDVLDFNPSLVKIFNTTFYLGSKTHFDGYRVVKEDVKENPFKGLPGFAHHDIVSNFMFVKNLYHFQRIEADEASRDVLQLSKEEFVEALKNNHPF